MENSADSEEPKVWTVVDFVTYYQQRTRVSACFLFLFVGLNVLLFPLYRHYLLGMPMAQPLVLPLVECFFVVPACILTALLRWNASKPAFIEWITLGGMFLVSAGAVSMGYLWDAAGGNFPLLANAIFLVAAAAMTGVDYRRLFMVAAPLLLAEIILGYAMHGVSPAAHMIAIFNIPSAAVVLATGWQVQRAMWQSWDEGRYFQRLSERDPMTGLLNRRAFEERARQVLLRAVQERRPVVLALLDFDQFARFNKICGRAVSDRALKVFARLLGRYARQPLDLVARLGEDEFALLWFDVTDDWARARAEMINRAAREMDIGMHKPIAPLRASIGSVCAAAAAKLEVAELLREADANLRTAKANGGDCVVQGAFGQPCPAPDAAANAA